MEAITIKTQLVSVKNLKIKTMGKEKTIFEQMQEKSEHIKETQQKTRETLDEIKNAQEKEKKNIEKLKSLLENEDDDF